MDKLWCTRAEAEREYRYISPVILAMEGDILYISSAALTNNPDLKMKALNTATGGDMQDTQAQHTAAAKPDADTDASPKIPVAMAQPGDKETARPAARPAEGIDEPNASGGQPGTPNVKSSLEDLVPRGDYDQLQRQQKALASQVQR